MALKNVVIGYAKGDKGDKGDTGERGATGQTGPQGEPGNIADAAITDTQGLDVAKGAKTTAQKLFDAIADRIVNKLVTNDTLTTKLADYLLKSAMSSTNIDSTTNVPTSALVYSLLQDVNNNLSVEVNDLTDLLNPNYYDPAADYYLRIYRVGNVKVLSIAIKAKALTGNDIIASNIPEKLRPDKSAYIVIQGRDVGEWARATYTPVVLEISGISISMSTGVNASKLTYICGMAAYV